MKRASPRWWKRQKLRNKAQKLTPVHACPGVALYLSCTRLAPAFAGRGARVHAGRGGAVPWRCASQAGRMRLSNTPAGCGTTRPSAAPRACFLPRACACARNWPALSGPIRYIILIPKGPRLRRWAARRVRCRCRWRRSWRARARRRDCLRCSRAPAGVHRQGALPVP